MDSIRYPWTNSSILYLMVESKIIPCKTNSWTKSGLSHWKKERYHIHHQKPAKYRAKDPPKYFQKKTSKPAKTWNCLRVLSWVIKCPHWTSPNHEWYMVNAMATISGDVQYTQNGTVTNPCFSRFHKWWMFHWAKPQNPLWHLSGQGLVDSHWIKCLSGNATNHGSCAWNLMVYTYIWVNYNISLIWIKAIWGWFPLLTMIPVRSQWGRYNLPIYIYIYMMFLNWSSKLNDMELIIFKDIVFLNWWYGSISSISWPDPARSWRPLGTITHPKNR